jgi:hypothetical protein
VSRLAALALAACACSRQPPATPTAADAAPAVRAAAPDARPSGPIARDLSITTPAGNTARVKVTVPADWTVSAYGATLRNGSGESVAGVEFMPTCDGDCTKAAQNLETRIEGSPEGAARPNLNTGNPELDAVRLDVAVLDKGDLPDGKYVVMRITKPAGLQGPYREQVKAVCARLVPAKDRFLLATAWAPVAEEKTLGPAAIAACKTFEILP